MTRVSGFGIMSVCVYVRADAQRVPLPPCFNPLRTSESPLFDAVRAAAAAAATSEDDAAKEAVVKGVADALRRALSDAYAGGHRAISMDDIPASLMTPEWARTLETVFDEIPSVTIRLIVVEVQRSKCPDTFDAFARVLDPPMHPRYLTGAE
jgi:hypothetical protein